MIKNQSKLTAMFISYAATGMTMVANIILKPFYIAHFGLDGYGLYTYIYAIAQYAIVMDLGISTVMTKYITEYRSKKDKIGEKNFAFHCLLIVIGAVTILSVMGIIIYNLMPGILSNRPAESIVLGMKMVRWMFLQIAVVLFQHYFDGIMLAYERFKVVKGIALLRTVLRFGLTLVLILGGNDVVSIAIGDAIATIICVIVSVIYVFFNIKSRMRWYRWEFKVMRQAGILMTALLLQSVTTYFNNSVGKILLGAMVNDSAVAIFDIAMTFIMVLTELPVITNSVFLPSVTKLVVNNADGHRLTDEVIKVGRYQMLICSLIFGGFLLFGQHFLKLWTGENTLVAWFVALIMMIPTAIPLIQQICLSILTAKDKRIFRSLILIGCTGLNFGISIVLIPYLGIFGVAIGTALSLIIGNIIIMNIYYKKKIKIEIGRMFCEIMKGILPCFIITTIVCSLLLLIPLQGYVWLFTEAIIFCIVFAVLLYFFGLKSYEKARVDHILKRRNISGYNS